jgi:hypothetical protein
MVHFLGDYHFHSQRGDAVTAICYIYPYILIVFFCFRFLSITSSLEATFPTSPASPPRDGRKSLLQAAALRPFV